MDLLELDELLSSIGNSYFDSLTHPATQDFEHSKWDTFVKDLTTACDSAFPRTLTRYTKVHALLLNWIDDDLNTDTELSDLGTTLKTQFNFTTEIWKIPSQEAENELEKKLSKVKEEHGGRDKLLIVYYGGHGKWDSNNRSIWAANRLPGSPTLNWSELQSMLKRAPFDVLILLDCCYAGSAGRENVDGTKELLAACGMEVVAEGVTNHSFTRNLIHKLKSFGSQPFTVSEIYERLLKAKKRLRNTPQYVPLSGRGRPSICIAPLELATSTMPALSSVSSSPQDLSSLVTIASSTSASTPASTISSAGPRVLLAISLKDELTVPCLDSWIKWLSSDAPEDIRRINVRIEEVFPSNSTLVLISMPVGIWNRLPDTSAYRFVDFITGKSYLKTVTGKAKKQQGRDHGDTFQQLCTAASNGHVADVRLLLEHKIDDNDRMTTLHLAVMKDDYGRTALLWAARGGHEIVVQLLLDKGADVRAKDYSDRTPLLWAVGNGHEAVVKLLLEKGAEIESKDNSGQTPLSLAAINGHEAVAKLLLDKGAELESKNKSGQTPLLLAAMNGHEAVAKLLLENGAELESKNKSGQTPLLLTAMNGREAVAKLLLENDAELESKDSNWDQTPLLWAAGNGHEAVVRLLLEKGAKAESKNKNSQTPLSLAAMNGHEAIAKLLLEKGAKLESKDNIGQTPLSLAAMNGHEAIAKLLLEKGAKLESKDNIGQTPLSWAAMNGHKAVVALLLLKTGAELESKGKSGWTPLS